LFSGKSTNLLPTELHYFLTPIGLCTKSFVGRGFAPDPNGGAYSAPPGPLAVFWESTSKGRGGEGERRGREEKGKRERRGEWRERVRPLH